MPITFEVNGEYYSLRTVASESVLELFGDGARMEYLQELREWLNEWFRSNDPGREMTESIRSVLTNSDHSTFSVNNPFTVVYHEYMPIIDKAISGMWVGLAKLNKLLNFLFALAQEGRDE